jgi:glycosidase
MRILLDGVFNHVSSDSPVFDRAGRYPEAGACESADSPWAAWFTLSPGPPEKCFDGQTYEDWFGFDTLAVIAENPETFGYFLGEEGIATRWLASGIGGWRLDVMNEISHDYLRGLRRSIKTADPDALILGEEWGDASAWLLGTEADSVMNYRFRRAVIGLVNGETADADGAIAGLTPTEFAATMEGVREDYPAAAWDVLHNLVDSHDTTRILWTLTPGAGCARGREGEAPARGGASAHLAGHGRRLLRHRGRADRPRRPGRPATLPVGRGGPRAARLVRPPGHAARRARVAPHRRSHLPPRR